MERENARLVSWLWQRVNDRHVAEDIAQDTYLSLWRHRDTVYDWTPSILYATARCRLLDYTRYVAPKRRRTCSIEAVVDVVDPHNVIDRADDIDYAAREWERCLSLLTPAETAVVLLMATGASGAEVAARLGIPEGTVKSRLSNARTAPHRLIRPRNGRRTA